MNAQSEQEDKALMKKIAFEGQGALDKLYRKHRRKMERFVRCKLGGMSALEVDDLVHDIFIKVQRVATQYRPHRRARTLSWIFKLLSVSSWIAFGNRKAGNHGNRAMGTKSSAGR